MLVGTVSNSLGHLRFRRSRALSLSLSLLQLCQLQGVKPRDERPKAPSEDTNYTGLRAEEAAREDEGQRRRREVSSSCEEARPEDGRPLERLRNAMLDGKIKGEP